MIKEQTKFLWKYLKNKANVYSLGGFTKAFNRGEINSNTDIIRII